jgi:ribA/ribD-fused uncharacterized protein
MTTHAVPACIDSFTDTYRFLHSYAYLATPIRLWEQNWLTAEHTFHAGKTANPSDFRFIRDAPTPGEAYRRGRKIALRPDWGQVRRQIMLQVVTAKFSNPDLRGQLVATGSAPLINGNSWGDDYWGAVPTTSNPVGELWQAIDGTYLAGYNWLGRILMMTRELMTPETT